MFYRRGFSGTRSSNGHSSAQTGRAGITLFTELRLVCTELNNVHLDWFVQNIKIYLLTFVYRIFFGEMLTK